MSEQLVDIVDENDVVIDVVSREAAHKKRLPHRVVNIWFFNNNEEVLMQKNAADKRHDAGSLSETVGGHVDAGETYDEAAIRETKEETGLELRLDDLVPVAVQTLTEKDKKNGMTHGRKVYAYTFLGNKEDLRGSEDEVAGFEWVSVRKFLGQDVSLQGRVASYLFGFDGLFLRFLKMAFEAARRK